MVITSWQLALLMMIIGRWYHAHAIFGRRVSARAPVRMRWPRLLRGPVKASGNRYCSGLYPRA